MKKMKEPNTVCTNCTKGIYRAPHWMKQSKNHFCNKKCHSLFQDRKVEKPCATCGKAVVKKQRALRLSKTGFVFCSTTCSNKARISNDAKFTYRERALKTYGHNCSNVDCVIGKSGIVITTKMLDVDHIDSNRKNNDIGNLQVLCVWCHALKTRKVDKDNEIM